MADEIPNPTPITKPAVAEKVFDKMFCPQLVINCNPSSPWSAEFYGVSYDGDKEILNDSFGVRLHDLKLLASQDPELAQAMGLTLAVIAKYLVKCKMKNIQEVNLENIEEVLSE